LISWPVAPARIPSTSYSEDAWERAPAAIGLGLSAVDAQEAETTRSGRHRTADGGGGAGEPRREGSAGLEETAEREREAEAIGNVDVGGGVVRVSDLIRRGFCCRVESFDGELVCCCGLQV